MDLPEAVERHLRAEYDGVFDEERLRRHVEDYVGLGLAGDQVTLLQERLPPGARILDVGAGYGSFVLAARDAGYDTVGVDVAPVEVTFARDRLRAERPDDDAEAVYGLTDGAALQFAAGSFDAVTLWNVLEHVDDRRAVIGEVARVLRPGGLAYVVAPNYAALRREAHYGLLWAPQLRGRAAAVYLRLRRRNPRFFVEHVRPCTAADVRAELAEAGFIVEDLTGDKLTRPEAIARPLVRSGVELAHRLGAAPILAILVDRWTRGPFRGSITLVGRLT